MEAIEILETAVRALDSKKGQNINAIKVDDLTVIADYFVIATANSSTQVRALAEEVEYQLDLKNQPVHHIEGRGSNWILLDYGSVIVHVFHREAREFYSLDQTWADGEQINIENFLS
ncbi:MAG: ribosome silencing factor [Acutalibacteraceae bacterium]|nr:ribosome silencing factor [Acutalibacteraceae bacterium]